MVSEWPEELGRFKKEIKGVKLSLTKFQAVKVV